MLGSSRASKALILATIAICLGSASVSAAGNPGRAPYPTGDDLYVACPQGFVGVLHITINKEYIKTFTAADGTIRYAIEGRLVQTWTGNGKTLTLNTSGPGTITVRPDGSVTIVTEGLTAVITRADDGFWIYTGQVMIDPDTGAVIRHHGSVRDMCALLA